MDFKGIILILIAIVLAYFAMTYASDGLFNTSTEIIPTNNSTSNPTDINKSTLNINDTSRINETIENNNSLKDVENTSNITGLLSEEEIIQIAMDELKNNNDTFHFENPTVNISKLVETDNGDYIYIVLCYDYGHCIGELEINAITGKVVGGAFQGEVLPGLNDKNVTTNISIGHAFEIVTRYLDEHNINHDSQMNLWDVEMDDNKTPLYIINYYTDDTTVYLITVNANTGDIVSNSTVALNQTSNNNTTDNSTNTTNSSANSTNDTIDDA